MRKTILKTALLSLILLPTLSLAEIKTNLSYGIRSDDVMELQENLIEDGCITGQATGFFGPITLKAVKCFQAKNNLPVTGYVGAMTRKVINDNLTAELQDSNAAQVEETGTSTNEPVVSDSYKAALEANRLLGLQMQAQLDTQAKLDKLNDSIKSLQPTPTPIPTPPIVPLSILAGTGIYTSESATKAEVLVITNKNIDPTITVEVCSRSYNDLCKEPDILKSIQLTLVSAVNNSTNGKLIYRAELPETVIQYLSTDMPTSYGEYFYRVTIKDPLGNSLSDFGSLTNDRIELNSFN